MIYKLPVSEFFYLRHGQTTDNRDGILTGGERDKGVHLTEEGKAQAESRSGWLVAKREITLICRSPMARVDETVQGMNREAQKLVIEIPNLIEWRIGDYAGMPEGEFGEGLSNFTCDPPGGETREELKRRVHDALMECFRIETRGKVLVAAHKSVGIAIKENLGITRPDEIENCVPYKFFRVGNAWDYQPELL